MKLWEISERQKRSLVPELVKRGEKNSHDHEWKCRKLTLRMKNEWRDLMGVWTRGKLGKEGHGQGHSYLSEKAAFNVAFAILCVVYYFRNNGLLFVFRHYRSIFLCIHLNNTRARTEITSRIMTQKGDISHNEKIKKYNKIKQSFTRYSLSHFTADFPPRNCCFDATDSAALNFKLSSNWSSQ